MTKKTIVAIVITLALLMLCGCELAVDNTSSGRTVEIGDLSADIPEGYRTFDEYQKIDNYRDLYTEESFEIYYEVSGVKPEYKYFINIDSGSLSTNWFSQDHSEDEIWDGVMSQVEEKEPEEVSYEEPDIEGLEDVRLQCFISNNSSFYMEGDKRVYNELDIALTAFTYEGRVYVLELSEEDTNAKSTSLKETRQRMMDILNSISTHLAEA